MHRHSAQIETLRRLISSKRTPFLAPPLNEVEPPAQRGASWMFKDSWLEERQSQEHGHPKTPHEVAGSHLIQKQDS